MKLGNEMNDTLSKYIGNTIHYPQLLLVNTKVHITVINLFSRFRNIRVERETKNIIKNKSIHKNKLTYENIKYGDR